MNGEFDDDDFSDISVSAVKVRGTGADDLDDDSDVDEQDEFRTRFTADGLVKIDRDGNIVEKVGASTSQSPPQTILAVGTRVSAMYHAKEQMEGEETWFNGTIATVKHDEKSGKFTYNVDYDDGDFEDDVEPEHIKVIGKTEEELEKENEEKSDQAMESQKRQRAKEKAR